MLLRKKISRKCSPNFLRKENVQFDSQALHMTSILSKVKDMNAFKSFLNALYLITKSQNCENINLTNIGHFDSRLHIRSDKTQNEINYWS